MRNVFLQRDARGRRDLYFREKSTGGAHDEVVFASGKIWIVATKLKLIGRFDLQRIMQCDRRDQRFDIVKAILAPAQDSK